MEKKFYIEFNGKRYQIPTEFSKGETLNCPKNWLRNSTIITPQVGQELIYVRDGKITKCFVMGSFVTWVWSVGDWAYRAKNHICLYFVDDHKMHMFDYDTFRLCYRLMLFESVDKYIDFLQSGGNRENVNRYNYKFDEMTITTGVELNYAYEIGNSYGGNLLKRYFIDNDSICEGEVPIDCIKYDCEGFKMYCDEPEGSFIHKKDLIDFMVNGVKAQAEEENEFTYEVEVKHKVKVTASSPEEALEKARAMFD